MKTCKCVKKGCDEPRKKGKNLCERHSKEWEKIGRKLRGEDIWETYEKYINDEDKQRVMFT